MQIHYYIGDIQPKDNVIFVFGSNPLGINGNPENGMGGAALVAQQQFGVEQGEKMINCISKSGKAYGLVTVQYPGGKRSLNEDNLCNNISILYKTAIEHPEKLFCIAYRNWGTKSLNGYYGYELYYMFIKTANEYYNGNIPKNIIFSKEWCKDLIQPSECIINFDKQQLLNL